MYAAKKLTPRKKFDIRAEINESLRRFKNQQTSEWIQVPVKSLLTRMNNDIITRKTFVVGTKFSYIPQNLSEVISHIKVFGTPQIKAVSSTKVAGRPMYSDFTVISTTGTSHTPNFALFNEFESYLEMGRNNAREGNLLEPSSSLYESLSGDLTPHVKYLALASKFLSFLMAYSLESAYKRYLEFIQTDEHFRKIDPTTHYAFLLNLHVRGIADVRSLRQFENFSFDVEQSIKALLEMQNGNTPPVLVSRALSVIKLNQAMIQAEGKIIRAPKIEYPRISQSEILAFIFDKFLQPKIPKKILYRIKSGYTVIPEDVARFTMLSSVGESIGEGAAKKIQERIGDMGDEFLNRLDASMDRGTRNLDAVSENITDRVSRLIKETFKNGLELANETTDQFVKKSKELIEMLPKSFSALTDSFASLESMLKTVLNQFKSNVTSFIKPEFEFNAGNLLEALKYYVLFINVDNSLLKSILFMLIINSFGGLGMMWKFVKPIIDYLTPKTNTGECGNFTSGDSILSFIFSSVKGFSSLVTGVFGSIIAGRILSFSEFSNLTRSIANPLRDISFIARGLDGIISLFTKFKQLISFIVTWVRKNVFKIEEEKVKIAKRVVRWTLLTRYFSVEKGQNAIRLSAKARSIAKSLFAEGLELSYLVSPTGKFADKDLYSDITRLWRDAKVVSSYVIRLEAMSSFQPTMFHIQLVGQAGVGKSKLTEHITRRMLRNLYGKEEEMSFYSMNPNVDHFDGYAGQKVMIVDDIFRYDDPKHLTALIGLITNTPVILPMANLEDKGTQLTSEIMVSSTNKAYPSGKDIFCMEAVHRRRHMLVRVEIDPRVRSKATGSFEEALFREHYPNQNMEDFPHLTFSLLKPVPERPDIENIHADDDIIAARLAKTLKMLNEANDELYQINGNELPQEVLYRSKDELPEGVMFPCQGWNFQTFILNCEVRFRAFRRQEGKLSAADRIASCVESIDELEEVISGWEGTKKDSELISKSLKGMMGETPLQEVSSAEIEQLMDAADMAQEIPDIEDALEVLNDPNIKQIIGESEFTFLQEEDSQPSTSTGGFTTLDQETEMSRRRRILTSHRRREPTANIGNPLTDRVTQCRHGIQIKEDMTIWDNIATWNVDHDSFRGIIASTNLWIQSALPFMEDAMLDSVGSVRSMNQEGSRLMMCRYFTFPKSDGVTANYSGQQTKLPLFFLNNLQKVNGKWYFKSGLELESWNPYFARNLQINVIKNGTSYQIPCDEAFVWSCSQQFRNFVHEFHLYGETAQDEIVRYAKWRNQYTGFYTADALLEFSQESMLKYPILAYKYVSQPIYALFNMDPVYFTFIFSVLALVATVWLLRKVASLVIPKTQETSKYLHRGPQSNLIYKGRFTSTDLFGENTQSTMIESLFKRNIRKIIISDGNHAVMGQGLFSGQFLIFNKHALRKLSTGVQLTLSLESPSCDNTWEYPLPWNQIYSDPNGDLAIAYSIHWPMAKSIEHHFLSDREYKDLENPGELIFLSANKNQVGITVNQYLQKVQKITLSEITMDSAVLAEGSTFVGRSGSTVAISKGVKNNIRILGIQAWEIGGFFSNQIAVQVVTGDTFTRLKSSVLTQMDIVPIERQADFEDTPVSMEDAAAFTSATFNNIITTRPKNESVGIVTKTQFKLTPISKFMDMDGHASERIPAVHTPYDPLLAHKKKIHPLNHSLNKYFKDKVNVYNTERLKYIEDSIVCEAKARLDKTHFTPLTFDQVVTGTREDGSNPMNLATSPGLPYVLQKREKKGKKDYLEIDEEGELAYVNEDFLAQYKEFRSDMMQGKLPLTLSYDFSKDELRPIKKALGSVEDDTPPKTRSVTCMNMLYVMLWRELTLDMWASFHRLADGTYPLCPGINPEGPEWSNAYHYLNQHPEVVDFDVSNWDGFLTPQLAFTAASIICRICGYAKNSPEEIAIRGIVTEFMFGYIQYGQVVYQKHRGMLSGFPGTAEINSLCHYILIAYIYLELAQGTIYNSFLSFKLYTSSLIYGDDIIISIAPEVFEFFHGLSIAEVYKAIGYPVTSAVKNEPIVRSKSLHKCSFLKGTWREFSTGIWIRQMDISVAYDLLYWNRSSEQPLEQFYDNATDALRIVFGHGKATYDKFLEQLNGWLKKAKLPAIVILYDDLYFDHMRKYYVDYF